MTKRIVLCSDGTGNAEGKNRGTNVFKIYKAIARHDPSDLQVGFYDNGVGTEQHKIPRTIGGAFGWGFARNVKDLYTFLARTYEANDEVFLFGFSRGAATVRAFAGFLHHCGLVDFRAKNPNLDREQQDALIEQAFAAYKEDGEARARFKHDRSVAVRIKFIGVWDTVSALGFPKDLGVVVELLEAAAMKLFPHGFYDFELNDEIDFACQALSLDDQRKTFEPRVWKEKGKRTKVDQTWFAGMHSNVGGGYPRQGMSNTTLHWMMTKAREQGLRFNEGVLEDVAQSADETGRMYDSRAGLAIYYRLQPRDLAASSDGKTDRIRVHETVLTRLRLGTAGYAPGNLPETFDVVRADGSVEDAARSQLDVAAYRREVRNLARPIARRQSLHSRFVWLSLIVAALLITAGCKSWDLPDGWAMPMEVVACAALLGCAVSLRSRMTKWLFWTTVVAVLGLAVSCLPYWIPSFGGWSPFTWTISWCFEVSTWFIPSFLEDIAAQALVEFSGLTALLLFLFVGLWSSALDLRAEHDRICERAREQLRGKTPDVFVP